MRKLLIFGAALILLGRVFGDAPDAAYNPVESRPTPNDPSQITERLATPRASLPQPAQRPDSITGQPTKQSLALYVTGSMVRVRAGPGTSFDRLGALQRGARVSFTGQLSGVWKQVRAGGLTGWMHGNYLSETVPQIRQQTVAVATPKKQRLSDREIAQRIIRHSMAGYSGSCPCPFNRDRAGRKCGKRSAYSRPGGAAPFCYVGDVSKAMIARWRSRI